MTGEITVYSVRAYKHNVPQRGDIIYFDGFNYLNKNVLLCKRVIGVPGDVIEFADGDVYINGSKYEEEYLPNGVVTECEYIFVVPDDCVFVLGDNRMNSFDSRFFNNAYVSYEDIKGKHIWGKYYKKASGILLKIVKVLERIKRLIIFDR